MQISKVHHEVLEANVLYSKNFGIKSQLNLPPARKFAILTCMDARLDPAGYAGLSEGDAHVIRNAGGRASDDAIRSLIISHKLLGTNEWFVIHHTNCGMQLFTDDIMRDLLDKSLSTATVDEKGWKNLDEKGGSEEAKYISFLTFKDLANSVTEDVERIRNHPLVNPTIPIYGYIYDVKSGKLVPVEEAMEIGKVS
jgi:carbonic anhydrase